MLLSSYPAVLVLALFEFGFVGDRQQSEGRVGKETGGHDRIEKTRAQTEESCAIDACFNAEAMVKLQADAYAGEAVLRPSAGEKSDPVVAGDRYLLLNPAAQKVWQMKEIVELVSFQARFFLVKLVLF